MQDLVLLVFFSLSLNTKSDSTCKTKEFDLHQRQLLTKFNKVNDYSSNLKIKYAYIYLHMYSCPLPNLDKLRSPRIVLVPKDRIRSNQIIFFLLLKYCTLLTLRLSQTLSIQFITST